MKTTPPGLERYYHHCPGGNRGYRKSSPQGWRTVVHLYSRPYRHLDLQPGCWKRSPQGWRTVVPVCFMLNRYLQLLVMAHITYNGPAIWVGCVTRRCIWARSRYPPAGGPESCHAVPRRSGAKSGVQGGYGAVFAIQVQVL
jgi:hypothetical protein